MNDIQKRFLLFLIGCMGVRSLLVYLAKTVSKHILLYMGYVAILPAIGFFYIYYTGTRQTGPEVFGDKIWWNQLRPVHGTLYATFAYYAITGNSNAWIWLLIDLIIGFVSFIYYQYTSGNMKLLFH